MEFHWVTCGLYQAKIVQNVNQTTSIMDHKINNKKKTSQECHHQGCSALATFQSTCGSWFDHTRKVQLSVSRGRPVSALAFKSHFQHLAYALPAKQLKT